MESDIDISNILVNKIPDVPNWDSVEPNVCLSLSQYCKSYTLPQQYKEEYNIIKSNFSDFSPIYTDGSKQDDKVASAYVCKAGKSGIRLPDGSSIFTAEAKAVVRSLTYVRFSRLKKFIIYSDSLSLLESIQTLDSKNPLVCLIYKLLNIIDSLGKEVVFCWVPSHCGILGNELVDKEAKLALSKEITPMPIPVSDFLPLIKQFIVNSWQQYWDEQLLNKLHSIKPKLSPPSRSLPSRKEQIVINRLKLGHTRLTHSFLMDKSPIPVCTFCNNANEILTVKHILLHCPTFNRIRSNYWTVQDMKSLFELVIPAKIVEFLKDCDLFEYL